MHFIKATKQLSGDKGILYYQFWALIWMNNLGVAAIGWGKTGEGFCSIALVSVTVWLSLSNCPLTFDGGSPLHSFFSGLGRDGMTLRVELRLETAIILKNLASSCEQFFLLKWSSASWKALGTVKNVPNVSHCYDVNPYYHHHHHHQLRNHQFPDNYNHVCHHHHQHHHHLHHHLRCYYSHHHHRIWTTNPHLYPLNSFLLATSLLMNLSLQRIRVKNKKHHSYLYYFILWIFIFLHELEAQNLPLFIYLIIYLSVYHLSILFSFYFWLYFWDFLLFLFFISPPPFAVGLALEPKVIAAAAETIENASQHPSRDTRLFLFENTMVKSN